MTLCRTCKANPPCTESLCLPCWKDKIAADRQRRQEEDRRQRRERGRAVRKPQARPETYSPGEFVNTATGAKLLGKCVRTIQNCCENHPDISHKVDGDWRMSRPGYEMLRFDDTGSMCDYGRGDRSSPRVVRYFVRLGIPVPSQK